MPSSIKTIMGSAIQMKVWRDRIELWNYGRLPEELTIEKLFQPHASNSRNKNIAFAFYKAGFIEAWGRGISKIVTQFNRAGLKEPKFEEFCGGVRVTIYRNTNLVQETIDKNNPRILQESGQKTGTDDTVNGQKTREKIIALIKNNNAITAFELAEALGITPKGVEWQLKQLKDKNVICRVGGDKGGHWEIVEYSVPMISNTP